MKTRAEYEADAARFAGYKAKAERYGPQSPEASALEADAEKLLTPPIEAADWYGIQWREWDAKVKAQAAALRRRAQYLRSIKGDRMWGGHSAELWGQLAVTADECARACLADEALLIGAEMDGLLARAARSARAWGCKGAMT